MSNAKQHHKARRDFLKGVAAAAIAPSIIPASALGADGSTAPSERVVMGLIGSGERGTTVMKRFFETDAQFAAVCDPFTDRREEARALVNDQYDGDVCEAYNDFRDPLARHDIDAVLIATQDHWHCPQGILAAQAGKDMYVEKPLGRTIEEGRALCKAVAKHNRIFQHGTQQRSDPRFRFACELVRNKKIGDLKSISVGTPASGELLEPQPEMPIPPGFDYDLWLGPAPMRPYTEKRCIAPWWWYNSDYTIGFVAGWGVHHLDIAQWGLGLDDSGPVEVEGKGVFPERGLCDTAKEYDLHLLYENGVRLDFADDRKRKMGVRFEGTEGWVHVNRSEISAEPKSLLDIKPRDGDMRLYASDHHQRNFIECVKKRSQTVCPPEAAQRSTTICHLSHIAMVLERKLKWDPQIERFIGDDEANGMISRAMRGPWHL